MSCCKLRCTRLSSNRAPAILTLLATVTLVWRTVTNAAAYSLYEGPTPTALTNSVSAIRTNRVSVPLGPLPRWYAVTATDVLGQESDFSRLVSVQLPFTNIVLLWEGSSAVISNAPTVQGPFVHKTNVSGTNAVPLRMNGSNEFFKADKPLTIQRQKQ